MQHQYTTNGSKVNTLFQKSLPKKLKCTNNKQYAFAKYRNKQAALRCEQITINEPNCVRMIALDIDRAIDPFDLSPAPNLVTVNKEDKRGHAIYILERPIHLNDFNQTKTKKYLLATYNGLVAHLKADPSYNQTFTKNPLCGLYNTYPLHDRLWDLDYLCEYVTPITKKAVNDETTIGWGRNCEVFETVRLWAYKAIRNYRDGNFKSWYQAVLDRCSERNKWFPIPLPANEIADTTKSISNWVWERRFELTSFTKQSARANKLALKRKESSRIKQKEALNLLSKGFKVPEIANTLGITIQWAYKLIRESSLEI